ncbi:MAG: DUF2157 domain-containing protein [Roseateles sp.]|uniref:DUF2157 domain-containing protein n=1 Tax=Roseateles sp. TaxID=1971397 RepID=UPI0039ECD2A8
MPPDLAPGDGREREPAALLRRLPLALMALAGLLCGLGLVFAVAAQWADLPRAARFALLQAAVALGALALVARPRLALPLGLWCLLATGGLLAFLGQTYQTGADAWQLFALWAALALPLALGARADALWGVWMLVALAAVSLWMAAHAGHRWRAEAGDLPVHLAGWALALGLALAAAGAAGRRVGAGPWARRTAAGLAVLLVMATALAALFGDDPLAPTLLALLALAGAAWALGRPAGFDLFGLSAAALALNVVLVGALARLLFDEVPGGEPIARFLLLGLAAAGLLAATVGAVLRLARRAEARA